MVGPLESRRDVADYFLRQGSRLGEEYVTEEVRGQSAEVVASNECKVVAVGSAATAGRYLKQITMGHTVIYRGILQGKQGQMRNITTPA